MVAALEGANAYLNNLLLARGLTEGKPLTFAQPSQDDIPKIINLVHDLVLRRDRDADRLERMGDMIKEMRLNESNRLLEFQQMQSNNAQLKSELANGEAQQRALRTSMRKTEVQVKELKEQTLKWKSMLDQVRAKCLSDVRKRDIEIEKLKGHIGSMQRGKKDRGGIKVNTINLQSSKGQERRNGRDVDSAGWSLEQETNDFLAALVNEASTENVELRRIVTDATATLKDLTGFEETREPNEVEKEDSIGIPGQYRRSRRADIDGGLISCQHLAEQIERVIEHCRSILRDPSFVPIEEVQIREEEITKLRAGWEKMADRWKEAVTMMAQWKQKMVQDGHAVDMGDFVDFSFGRSVARRPDGVPVLGQDDELSSIFEPDAKDSGPPTGEDNEDQGQAVDDEESELELEPEPPTKRLASSPAKRGLKLPRRSQPLGEINTNTITSTTNDARPCRPVQISGRSDEHSGTGRCNDVPQTENEAPEPRPSSLMAYPAATAHDRQPSVSQRLAAVAAEAAEAEAARKETKPHKRTVSSRIQVKGRHSKRRSTLSPAELAALMGAR